MTFIQLSTSSQAAARAAAMDRASEGAMKRLAAVATAHKNWALVSLAVRVRLDAFTKVKVAMDQMMAALETEQKDEYEKNEACEKQIDQTEDEIKEGTSEKEDLDEKHKEVTNTLERLDDELAKLKEEVATTEISLKQVGEDRHNQNVLFKTSVGDQRATVEILNKALARLKQFYATKDTPAPVLAQEPGAADTAPPPKPAEYSQSGSAGGVVQLLMKCIEDA